MAASIHTPAQTQASSSARADDMHVRPGFSTHTAAAGQDQPAGFAQYFTTRALAVAGKAPDTHSDDAGTESTDPAQTEPLTGAELSVVTAVAPAVTPVQDTQVRTADSKADLQALAAAASGTGSRREPQPAGQQLAESPLTGLTRQHSPSLGSVDRGPLPQNSHTLNAPLSEPLNKLLLSRSDTPLTASPGTMPSTDPSAVSLHSATTGQHAVTTADKPAWANIQVDTSQGKWGEQMLQILQDRVSMQAGQKMQEARIRLDPPELGKLDLLVKVDGDRLQVQLNANHAQVREALIQVSERLRHELQLQQFVQVDVNVGTDTPRYSSQPFYQDDADAYQVAAAHPDDGETSARSHSSDYWLSTSA